MLAPLVPAAIGPKDEALRAEVRAFLAERLAGMPGAHRARTWMGFDADFSRDLAARGWVGLTLPVEFGGGGRSPFARFVLIEELLAAGAPVAAHWIAERQSAPSCSATARRPSAAISCRASAGARPSSASA